MARILVIDDDVLTRQLLCEALEVDGHRVMEAIEGQEGLDLLKQHSFQLVITDIFMDGKDGLETIDELRRNYPHVKIIAISGGGDIGGENFLKTADILGAHRVVCKPFQVVDIMQMVDELLD